MVNRCNETFYEINICLSSIINQKRKNLNKSFFHHLLATVEIMTTA